MLKNIKKRCFFRSKVFWIYSSNTFGAMAIATMLFMLKQSPIVAAGKITAFSGFFPQISSTLDV